MLMRLIDFLKAQQITALFTSLTHGGGPQEQSEAGISSLVDTWLLMRDIELGGERNRGLYVLKSRGMAHSNQIREFLLTDQGIELRDVYVGPEGVLTGSIRLAQEAREQADALSRQQEIKCRQRELERKRQALEAQMATQCKQFEAEEEELNLLDCAGAGRRRTGTAEPGRDGPEPQGRHAGGGAGQSIPSNNRSGRTQMKRDPSEPKSLEELAATAAANPDIWELRLYVAGKTAKSVVAFENLTRMCEQHLAGKYKIEVVDLLVHPQLAKGDQIVAIPTLVRKLPQPIRKVIGDLSNVERTLVGLQLRPAKS